MGIWITYGSLIPLIVILAYLIYKEATKMKQELQLRKGITDNELVITHRDFSRLNLYNVEADYRLPRGQWAHFIYEVPAMAEATKKRKYTGNTVSGIKIPFMSISIQNREFKDVTDFIPRGPVKLTLTNKVLRIQSHKSDGSLKRDWYWASIEQVKFVVNDRTVQVSLNKGAWPMRFTFENTEQALEFSNAIWTLVEEYTNIDLINNGTQPDEKKNRKVVRREIEDYLNEELDKMEESVPEVEVKPFVESGDVIEIDDNGVKVLKSTPEEEELTEEELSKKLSNLYLEEVRKRKEKEDKK